MGRSATFADQPLPSLSVSVCSVLAPFAVSVTLTSPGRLPSWLSASSHALLTLASVSSTFGVLVTLTRYEPSSELGGTTFTSLVPSSGALPLTCVSITRYSTDTSSASGSESDAGTASGRFLKEPSQFVPALMVRSLAGVSVHAESASPTCSRMVSDQSPPAMRCCSRTTTLSEPWRSLPSDQLFSTCTSVPG